MTHGGLLGPCVTPAIPEKDPFVFRVQGHASSVSGGSGWTQLEYMLQESRSLVLLIYLETSVPSTGPGLQ